MNTSAKRVATGIIVLCVTTLAACAGRQQSIVDPRGPLAGRTAGLWRFFFWLCVAIFVIVIEGTMFSILIAA